MTFGEWFVLIFFVLPLALVLVGFMRRIGVFVLLAIACSPVWIIKWLLSEAGQAWRGEPPH